MTFPFPTGRRRRRMGPAPRRQIKMRLIVALVIAGGALFTFLRSAEMNPVTGERQYLTLTAAQEIQLGLQSRAQMMRQHGGEHPDSRLRAHVAAIGKRLVARSDAADTPWRFEFHLLADPQTVNAFALPGGQVFITYALLSRLTTDAQVAGVLGHEIGHVVARHSAQRIAKSQLTQGLIGAVIAASGDAGTAQMAQMIGQIVNMKYGRDDELESDALGVDFMSDAGYDPRGMIRVMQVLAEAGGGQAPPEFFSTHPNPENRIERIEEAIATRFPDGVPDTLER